MTISYEVIVNFNDGTYDYDFPHVQEISDSKENTKHTIIKGIASNGTKFIQGGKSPQKIIVNGLLIANDYNALTTLMNTMKSQITTSEATLTLKKRILDSEDAYTDDWSYTVRRISEIEFTDTNRNYRVNYVSYSITFLVISY